MSDQTQDKLWTVEDEIEESLRPCPRCGGKACIENWGEIVCRECGLWTGEDFPDLDSAAEWWNKQPLIDTYERLLAAVEAERDALRQRVAELEACADPEALVIAYGKGYLDAQDKARKGGNDE